MKKLFFAFALSFASFLAIVPAQARSLATDTVIVRTTTKPVANLVNNETPIILRKGENLIVKIEETNKLKTTVRIHSSLGKLVKEFMTVDNQISMVTDKLLPGIYLIIIKQGDKREVRKFLLTN
ncbi:MAG: T9SS C-terminal target domain-containing protein [Bacteroidetes bacterium]|nr:MAG: T9SS C-terminal target domain-containing protein [Bacteroidota bacterium]